MISVTLQRMPNIAYLSCLNYSYYRDFGDEYIFCLHPAFLKIDSFSVIICMVVHWDILLCKLFIFIMLRIFNWWMISNVDQMLFFLFFLTLDWISIFFFIIIIIF